MIIDSIELNKDIMYIHKYEDILCKKNIYICFDNTLKKNIKETEIPTDYYNSLFLQNEDFSSFNEEFCLEEVFVCLYQWCFNYQHFLTECLPKVFAFLHLKKINANLKIIIPNIPWIENFFLIFCNKNDLINNSVNLRIKNAYFASDKNRNMLKVDSFFYLMRDCVSIHYNFNEKKENFYFKRIPSNFNVINGRNIFNEDEFEFFLKKNNYNITSFENKDIYQKLKILSKINNAIFVNGASMMNFCFCNNDINLIIINHPGFMTDEGWLGQIYFNKKINYKIFNIENIHNIKISSNDSILININEFKKFL